MFENLFSAFGLVLNYFVLIYLYLYADGKIKVREKNMKSYLLWKAKYEKKVKRLTIFLFITNTVACYLFF